MTATKLLHTWTAEDGQCAAMGCPLPRLLVDLFCEQHRAIMDAGGQRPTMKPHAPDYRVPWTPPKSR